MDENAISYKNTNTAFVECIWVLHIVFFLCKRKCNKFSTLQYKQWLKYSWLFRVRSKYLKSFGPLQPALVQPSTICITVIEFQLKLFLQCTNTWSFALVETKQQKKQKKKKQRKKQTKEIIYIENICYATFSIARIVCHRVL